VLACAPLVPPLRSAPTYVTSFAEVAPARPLPGSSVPAAGLRAAATAAATVADVIDRWSNNFLGSGVGLYGGSWSYTGDAVTTFHLVGVRLTDDLAVSGTVVWSRYAHTVTVALVLKQVTASGDLVRRGLDGSVAGSWQTRALGAAAVLNGVVGGKPLVAVMAAP
jgi:hypothetical protein